MRFPLEVVRTMCAAWPFKRARAIMYNGTDRAEGGLGPGDAVAFVRALSDEMSTWRRSWAEAWSQRQPPTAPGYHEAVRRARRGRSSS